jgi:hypothetical protein
MSNGLQDKFTGHVTMRWVVGVGNFYLIDLTVNIVALQGVSLKGQ